MSLLDDKRNVFNTIGAYVSFMEQKKPPSRTDLYSSINNKKDIVPYLLDTLKVVVGTDGIKELTGKMITDLVGESEDKLKTILKKQFIQSNAGNVIPLSFINDGINIPIKDIDMTGKFKVSPVSDIGDLLYEKNISNFDKLSFDAIEAPNTLIPFTTADMGITYDDALDTFNIKPVVNASSTIGDYFINYIDNAQIINKKEFITNILNGIYGTISKEKNRTTEQVFEELKAEQLLNQALNDDDSFEIATEDYDALLTKAEEMIEGVVNYDMGCGMVTAELALSALTTVIGDVSGSTNPYVVSNSIESTIDSASTSDAEATVENNETIKDGFFQKLLKLFSLGLLSAAILAPQIRVLLSLMSSLQNDGVIQISTPSEDMKNFKVVIMCLVKDIIKIVTEFIFDLVISYLIALITPVIKKIIKEKINQYSKIILSLTPISKIAEATGLV